MRLLKSVIGAMVLLGFCAIVNGQQPIRLPAELLEAIEAAKAKAKAADKSDETTASEESKEEGESKTAESEAAAEFSSLERDRLKATWKSLDDVGKEEMRAYYAALDVKIEAILGIKPKEKSEGTLPDEIRALEFARTPDAILSARSQLGFAPPVMPILTETKKAAQWLHMHILAGEWQVLPTFLGILPEDDATAVYSHILRSTNKGDPTLLPEEVLKLGDAVPGDMENWQLDVLSQLLEKSARQYGKQPFLDSLRAGTKKFGLQDDKKRARTARLLVGGGLAVEAKDYLAPLDKARQEGDARVIYDHGRYHQELAANGLSLEPEKSINLAWQLLGEVTLSEKAKVELRKDAMKRAIDLLTNVPPAQASEWLSQVFQNRALGPAALEIVALKAISLGDDSISPEERAQGLAIMKAAVDPLLSQPDLDTHSLRVPMRMLTAALSDAVDTVVKANGAKRGVPRETSLLLRAAPGEAWLAAIEPSVAIRGYHAAIAIATIADETDIALDTLSRAIERFPRNSREFADSFLKLWIQRLNPESAERDDDFFYFYSWRRMPTAPLTRGRQRRNLDRLQRLVGMLTELGIESKELPSVTEAFKACHARTEVFQEAQIVQIFGAADKLPAPTAASLADSMREGLSGDWRSRQAQQSLGMRRSRAEIGKLVEVGYELAIRLASRARDSEPDSWRHAVLHAALNYDHLRYQQTQEKKDFATFNEVRRRAFASFEQAADRYASLVARGLERDDAGVYLTWFAAVLDAGEPEAEDAAAEADASLDQINRIASSMKKLPKDAYDRHIGAFARDIISSLDNVPPEKKPKVVESAVAIVGDHPAGAPLRNQHELYHDLLRDEIRLRLTIDGSDRIAVDETFGLSLTLRYTNSVDREVGGFDKYLYQESYSWVGGRYQSINFQERFRRNINEALGESFEVESIGFFEPLTPSMAVVEEGQFDWQEKPMAYVLVKAKDPSIDRIPPVSMDMHFDDQSGPVTLPVTSNSPPIDATAERSLRPIKKLNVEQVFDTRMIASGGNITIDVKASGDGVVPTINNLIDGLENALPGYKVAENGIETQPIQVVQTAAGTEEFMFGQPEENKEFRVADDNGIFRLATQRSWIVKLAPTGGTVGQSIQLPTLKSDIEGELTSLTYADMDIVPVEGASISVAPQWPLSRTLTIVAVGLLAIGGFTWWRMRQTPEAVTSSEDRFALPDRVTPLNTLTTLRRMQEEATRLNKQQRAELIEDIAAVERAHFAPNGHVRQDVSELRQILSRWSSACNR